MTQIHNPPRAYRPLAFGAVGGALAALVSLSVMIVATAAMGQAPQVAPNAVGAWMIRWLQTAEPSAMEGLYWDATVGGALVFLMLGTLIGAVFAGFLDRLPTDQPIIWGVLLGLALWVLTKWVIAPALDPVLVRSLPQAVQIITDLAFGLLLGLWVHAGRRAGPEDDAREPARDAVV